MLLNFKKRYKKFVTSHAFKFKTLSILNLNKGMTASRRSLPL